MAVSQEDIDRDCEIGRRAHRKLLDRLDGLAAAGELGPNTPSALPGWTKGVLITHIARNAESHRRLFDGAALGEVWQQYEGGVTGRTDGIEAGRGAELASVLDDVHHATEQLEVAWATTDWIGSGHRTLSRETPIVELPLLRAREVELHHVDLDIGYTFDDFDDTHVELELPRMELSWKRRQPAGTSSLPSEALALAPPQRLAWLTGRLVVDGLDPAGVF